MIFNNVLFYSEKENQFKGWAELEFCYLKLSTKENLMSIQLLKAG